MEIAFVLIENRFYLKKIEKKKILYIYILIYYFFIKLNLFFLLKKIEKTLLNESKLFVF